MSEHTVISVTDKAYTAYRCIAPACKALSCSLCNCAVPVDVYAALGAFFAEQERERIACIFAEVCT